MLLAIGALIASLFAARIDYHFKILPNQFTMFIALLGLSHCILFGIIPHSVFVFSTIIHLGIAIVLPRAFGMGDAKLLAGLGFFLNDAGWYALWLILTYTLAFIWGISTRISSIALGPHIVLAWIVCYVGDYAHVSVPNSG